MTRARRRSRRSWSSGALAWTCTRTRWWRVDARRILPGWLVGVGLVERLTGEAGGDDAGEVGAFEDVFVRAAQRVIDGLAGGLGLGDLLVELVELAPSEPLPVVERDGA